MEVAVSAVVSIVLGLLGGIGLERTRNARKDFEARRDAYKALLALADRYELAMWSHSDATREEIAALEREFGDARAVIEILGTDTVRAAAQRYEDGILRNNMAIKQAARVELVAAMRRDVGARNVRSKPMPTSPPITDPHSPARGPRLPGA